MTAPAALALLEEPPARHPAGVVDKYVQPAEGLLGLPDGRSNGIGVHDVRGHEHRPPAGSLHGRGRLGATIGINLGEHHVGTASGHGQGYATAYAGASACDQRHLVGEIDIQLDADRLSALMG